MLGKVAFNWGQNRMFGLKINSIIVTSCKAPIERNQPEHQNMRQMVPLPILRR